MKSRFGIVIRAYNVGKYIEKAVNSVLAQTFTDWTAVIVDDGSEDDTKYIAKKTVGRDSRFQVLEINRGGCVLATLEGVGRLDCEYICVLDGDDSYDRKYLEETEKVIKEYQPDIAAGGLTMIYESGQRKTVRLADGITVFHGEEFLNFVMRSTSYGLPMKAIKKSLFRFDEEKLCFFRKEKTNLNFNEDTYQIVPVICNAEKCVVTGSCLYNYTIRNDSVSHDHNPWSQVRFIFMTMEYMHQFLRKRRLLNQARKEYIMAECVRELLPRARYIVKRSCKKLGGQFHISQMEYYHVLSKSGYFQWTARRHGRINAWVLRFFMLFYK